MTNYVLGFLFSKDRERVLLLHKESPKWQKGKLNGVGGQVLDLTGETPLRAMHRKGRQEADIDWEEGNLWELVGVVTLPDQYTVYVYWATAPLRLDNDLKYRGWSKTEETPVWVAVEDLPFRDVVDHTEWLVPLCKARLIGQLIATVRQ